MIEDAPKLKLTSQKNIRVRYSPAPTGLLHLGGIRTALFNFLFARKNNGKFILRIEDTDILRSRKKYEKNIILSLKWLGIIWDEGPDIGGPHKYYRQSERKNIYSEYLQKLIKENKAYYCFCSKEELETEKEYRLSKGLFPRYSGKCAELSSLQIKKYLEEKRGSVIRLRVPSKNIEFEDIVRKTIKFDASLIGDFIIAKNINEPLYNFACAIDDYEMKITHIIRGEDLLSNTPKQILIQKSLNFITPSYAHLPLIFGDDKTKLSKRHGAKPILDYKKEGYLPETIINFVAFLGWNPGDQREIFSIDALIKEFALERVQRSPATFNIKRLDYLNGVYIRSKTIEELTDLCLPYLISKNLIEPVFELKERVADLTGYFGKEIDYKYLIRETKEEITLDCLKKIVGVYQERLKKLSEIAGLTDFFFKKELKYSSHLLKWGNMNKDEIKSALETSKKTLEKVREESWERKKLEEILLKAAEDFAAKFKKEGDRGLLLWPLRVALTGKKASATPFEIAEILGKPKTLERIEGAKAVL